MAETERALESFREALSGTTLTEQVRRAYARRVSNFIIWAQKHHEDSDLVTDVRVRDTAVRGYRDHLACHVAAKTVDVSLAALDRFYVHVGLGRPTVERLPRTNPVAPRRLTAQEQHAVADSATQMSTRDRALILVLLTTEHTLNAVAHASLSDLHPKGKPTHLSGLPLRCDARDAVRGWLRDRETWPGSETEPLWLNQQGGALSDRSVRSIVDSCGAAAGVGDLRPSTLLRTPL